MDRRLKPAPQLTSSATGGPEGPPLELLFQPVRDLLARPVMIVVEVQDDGVERQTLLTSDGTRAADIFEAVENAIETRADLMRILGKRVRAFVRGAKRAATTVVIEVFAEGLRRTPPCARDNRLGELELVFAGHLMHGASPSGPDFTPPSPGAHLSGTGRGSSRWRDSCTDVCSGRRGRFAGPFVLTLCA